MTNEEYNRLVTLAQTVLRTWNGGHSFGQEYFKTRTGREIIKALKEALDVGHPLDIRL